MKFDILFTETYDSIKYKDKLKTALIYLIPNISKKILNKIDSAYYQHIISVNGSDENVILFSNDIINVVTLLKQKQGFIIDFKNNEEYDIIYDQFKKIDYCYSYISRKYRKLLIVNNILYIIPFEMHNVFFNDLKIIPFNQYLRSIKLKQLL